MPILDKKNPIEVERYLNFIRSSKHRTLTQDLNWSDVKWDWENEQIYTEKDGEITGALSLLIKRLPIAGSLLYAPRGPICDINDMESVNNLIKEAEPLIKKYKAFALKMDPEVDYSQDLEKKYKKAGFIVRNKGVEKDALIQPRYNMILKFDDHDEESVMSKFTGKTRNRIRSAAKKGVYTIHGRSDEFLKKFYKIYVEMTHRNKLTARSFEYFVKMRDSFEGLRVYIAKHEEDEISAGITINYYGKLYYLYAGSTDVKRNLGSNQLMNYHMISWGIEEKGEQYDFGGVLALDKSDGLYEFKIGFCDKDGATEYIGEIDKVYRPLFYFAFNNILPKLQRIRILLTRK